MPFPYSKIIISAQNRCNYRPINCREIALPIGVNNRLKALINLGFMPSLDPPKSPLRRGTLIGLLSPPY